MAILNITEFRDLAEDSKGRQVQIGKFPAVRSQAVTYTTATDALALRKRTRFIRVLADADAFLEFNGAATASSMKIEANVAEYFGVDGSKEMTISVYDGSS